MGKPKPQLSGKWVIAEQNLVKFGLAGSSWTFNFVALKVILGSFSALAMFAKYDFKMLLLLQVWFFFQPNCLYVFLYDRPDKSYFLKFWNLKLKKKKENILKVNIVANGKMKNGKYVESG